MDLHALAEERKEEQFLPDDEYIDKNNLFSIGKAAKLSGVSAKTLRYYESLGLIQPKKICEGSGYRYYDEDTLLKIPAIKYYKQLGFHLNEITKLMISPAYSRQYDFLLDRANQLNKTKKELESSIIATNEWIDLIREAHLAKQNQQVSLKYYNKDETYCYLSQPFHYNYRESILNLDWTRYLGENGMEISGPVILKYASFEEKMEGKTTRATIMQRCLQHDEHTARCCNFGNFMALSTYHQGDLEDINVSYQKMIEYAQLHNYKIGKESYERYVVDYWTTQDPNEFVTEIIIPIIAND